MARLLGFKTVLVLSLALSKPLLAEEALPAVASDALVAAPVPNAPSFRQESSGVLSAAKTAAVFVLVLAAAGLGTAHLFRRRSSVTSMGHRIRVVDRQVVASGLLAVLVEVDDQKILVLQDKKNHSAVRLGNDKKY